jgi:hypothetical protein
VRRSHVAAASPKVSAAPAPSTSKCTRRRKGQNAGQQQTGEQFWNNLHTIIFPSAHTIATDAGHR